MYLKILVLVVCLIASNSFAESVCEKYDSVIDKEIKTIAIQETKGEIYDKSAPQQTSRYLKINHHLQILQINVALSVQNRCQPRKEPIDPFQYKLASINCIKQSLGEKGNQKACDFKTWKPD